ncbi:MAG: hypothetical protein GC160_08080 [Acidobacteria bacterium]|nr:hypothetical protein [Acidobacteriota bacterium]
MRWLWILCLACSASAQVVSFEWTERTAELGLAAFAIPGRALTAADLDGDGDFDLLLADRRPASSPAAALKNRGSQGFQQVALDLVPGVGTDVCAAQGPPGRPARAFASGPFGLYFAGGTLRGDFRACEVGVSVLGPEPLLYLAAPEGLRAYAVEDLEPREPVSAAGCDLRGVLLLPDEAILTCGQGASQRLGPGGRALTPVGTGGRASGSRRAAWAAGDIDGDGDADLVESANDAPPTLNRRAPDGSFVAEPLPTDGRGLGDALLFDADFDGDLDLALAQRDRVALFRNADGRGRFEPAGAWEVAAAALAEADLDGDRRPEIIARSAEGDLHVYSSRAPGGFLTLRLEGWDGATAGAAVTLVAGGRRQSRRQAGSGDLHFGLGAETTVDQLRIVWPSGRGQLAQGLRTGKAYRVREGAPVELLEE